MKKVNGKLNKSVRTKLKKGDYILYSGIIYTARDQAHKRLAYAINRRTKLPIELKDAVFDHVGEQSWLHSMRSLKKGGKIVTCGATTGPYVRLDLRHLFMKHQQIIGSTMGNRKDLAEICDLIERDILDPKICRIYGMDEISAAHTHLEENNQMGKVVLSL